MPPPDVSRLLSRIANDNGFRTLLAEDPDAALSGYDLTPEEARRFATGGSDALSLLTWEARGADRPASKAHADEAAPLINGQPLDAVGFLLQITPTLQPGPDGTPEIAHAASLHMPGAPPSPQTGVLFRLRISPLARSQPDGTSQVSYTAAIEPVSAAPDPSLVPDTAVPTAPWGHDTQSESVLEAAQSVQTADSKGRHAAILTLIAAVTGGMS